MSYVPPSPPNAINLTSFSLDIFPCFLSELYAASTPEHVAAAFSNALCTNEQSFHEVYG